MQNIPVILLGVGGVGSALIQQVVANRPLHAAEYGIEFALKAICDGDGAVIALDAGLDDPTLLDLVDYKARKGRLAMYGQGGPQNDLVAIIDIAGRTGAIVVDCTASESTVPALLYALERKYRVVLANKKPLTLEQEMYDRLTRAGATAGNRTIPRQPRIRWETTCGAGLPVIVTLNRLVAAGDPVTRIAGAFSGTLGFVMTGLQQGLPFSAVVREAYDLGYTEPDPRDDLGGIDVARKALILARGLGWRLKLSDIDVTGLYPQSMSNLSVNEFMAALPELDSHFRMLVDEAATSGKVLRYAATIADGHCTVGAQAVDVSSPLGRLQGTDNLVEFHTRWYRPAPLVVQGRGAGTDATAAGVLAEMVELAAGL